MALVNYPSQHRESRTIWRIFETLPLFASLAGGRIFRWFAVNIPMDLGTGGGAFTSDIDIIACLREIPPAKSLVFKTWEVKVAVLLANGRVKSLKAGKTPGILKQLRAYRHFGSPHVSLLDVFVCEDGYLAQRAFPPEEVRSALVQKVPELAEEGFGHEILTFEHFLVDGKDVDLKVIGGPPPLKTTMSLLQARPTHLAEPFARLVRRIDLYFDSVIKGESSLAQGWPIVVFCWQCRQLDLVRTKQAFKCSRCGIEFAAEG